MSHVRSGAGVANGLMANELVVGHSWACNRHMCDMRVMLPVPHGFSFCVMRPGQRIVSRTTT